MLWLDPNTYFCHTKNYVCFPKFVSFLLKSNCVVLCCYFVGSCNSGTTTANVCLLSPYWHQALRGFEPRSVDSGSKVRTVTPRNQLTSFQQIGRASELRHEWARFVCLHTVCEWHWTIKLRTALAHVCYVVFQIVFVLTSFLRIDLRWRASLKFMQDSIVSTNMTANLAHSQHKILVVSG